MNDYMTALLERFKIETASSAAMAEQVKTAEDHLREQLGKEQRRLLLRLTDLHNALREEAQLGGFIAGYRLAEGIHKEMDIPSSPLSRRKRNGRGKSLRQEGISNMGKRRPAGDGMVRKRGDGRWEGRIVVPDQR